MDYSNSLYHHGIKGQKWGVRRYQNADGSYTSAGRSRYGINSSANRALYKSGKKKLKNRLYAEYDRHENAHEEQIEAHNKRYGQYQNNHSGKNRKLNRSERKAYEAGSEKLWNEYESKMNESRANYKKDLKNLKQETGQTLNGRWNGLSDKQKKAIKIGAVVAGTALAAYATYKIAGPKIAAYRNNKAIQASVSRARMLLQTGNQNSRNYAKKTIFQANSRTRQAAVNRNFPEYRVDSNNVYGVGMVKRVNISRPGSYRNMSRYKSPNFRVSGRASTNSTMSRRGINRSYTAKVRSDSAKVKQMTAELMKDHNWDSKTAENYAWWQLRNRGAYYNN